MPPIAVIDFETTGISPGQGARATEVAIVLLENGKVVDRFQSLMKTGAWIPPFITQLTGITNAMVAEAPPAAEVMREAARFVGPAPMVAHNAAFDSKFWGAELAQAGVAAQQPFACTVIEDSLPGLHAARAAGRVPPVKFGWIFAVDPPQGLLSR